jgi:rod shape-determining protein MreC
MRRSGGPWLAWILLLIALVLLILSESGTLDPVETLLGYVIAPVERAVAAVVGAAGSVTGGTRDIAELQQRVAELETANAALIQENFRLREYQAETAELRRQLDFRNENPTYGSLGADVVERGCLIFPCGEVVGQDTNPYLRFVIINVGSGDGVAVGMPVVAGGSAMIGRVARVSPNLSYVQLINDPTSQVLGISQASRVTGVVVGTEEGALVMTDILPDEELSEGETIVTASIGGMLPRGLILGQLEEVTYLESELFQRATVRPAVDFRRVEAVLVITDFPQPNLEELETP